MKGMKYTLTGWLLLLCAGLFSCTEDAGMPQQEEDVQPVQVALELCVPAPTLSRSTSLSEVDEDRCALFAFQGDKLLWVRVTDGSTDGMYLTGNELHFTCEETTRPIDLIMLANVELSGIVSNASLKAGVSKDEAMNALKAITYESTASSGQYIPMAGELPLGNGISSTTTGSIKLRRSLAKISVTVTYDEGLEERFTPRAIKIVNANATAAVYASGTEPAIPANPTAFNREVEIPFNGNETVQVFVAETRNDKTVQAEGEKTQGIAVLVVGAYKGPAEGGNGTVEDDDCWYRLDMIEDTSEMEEIDYLLRNHHYRFVIRNLNFAGAPDEETVLKRKTPHNAHFYDYGGDDFFEILDEEILSITTEYFDDDNPYYVGVSSTTAEMNLALMTRAVVRVEVVTNHYALKLDANGLEDIFTFVKTVPEYEEGDPNKPNARISGTIWIWENPGVTKPGTYTYYLYCGNIRKQMTIKVREI